jgi:resolvase-like protein
VQRLLADIRAGRIDLVVIYKVDRLTRSLADFAKLVEIFDARGVSFVSITQHFNTTTSIGRLTLNMLLSFAQFEREVTGERIRDKIAASKRRGMWMGGPLPLGYDVHDRKLVVNEAEAETVPVDATHHSAVACHRCRTAAATGASAVPSWTGEIGWHTGAACDGVDDAGGDLPAAIGRHFGTEPCQIGGKFSHCARALTIRLTEIAAMITPMMRRSTFVPPRPMSLLITSLSKKISSNKDRTIARTPSVVACSDRVNRLLSVRRMIANIEPGPAMIGVAKGYTATLRGSLRESARDLTAEGGSPNTIEMENTSRMIPPAIRIKNANTTARIAARRLS